MLVSIFTNIGKTKAFIQTSLQFCDYVIDKKESNALLVMTFIRIQDVVPIRDFKTLIIHFNQLIDCLKYLLLVVMNRFYRQVLLAQLKRLLEKGKTRSTYRYMLVIYLLSLLILIVYKSKLNFSRMPILNFVLRRLLQGIKDF